jgi:DNA-binding PadR family transcriptional regulator
MNDLLLLATLLGGPKHGYALKKQAGLISGQTDMHNNMVYPLLRRFVENGWVSKRQAAGQRGQTREVYTLTAKGKKEVLRQAAQFTEREASSESEFAIRVGLFGLLDGAQRLAVLRVREEWLEQWEEKFGRMQDGMNIGEWGGEVVRFLRAQMLAEREWIAGLKRKLKKQETRK